MEFETKYFRCLKDFDFDKININSFNTLASSGIFDEYELSKTYKNEEDYFKSDSDFMCFGDFFIQNRKEYHLKKEVYTEMIYVKNWYLESFNIVEEITNEIEVLISSELQLEEKLKIIEENYKKYFNQITDKIYYPLFKNETYTCGYSKWEQYFISYIVDNDNYNSVKKFLKGDNDFLDNEINIQWTEYFVVSRLSDYCEEKKNSLLNIKENILEKRTNNIDLSFQLAIIEEIMKINNWEEISPEKKGQILTHLLGKNDDNIRKYYVELNRKSTDIKSKFYDKFGKYQSDKLKAEQMVKNLLG